MERNHKLHAANTNCRHAVLGFLAAQLAHALGSGDAPVPANVAVYDEGDNCHEGWYLVWVALTDTEALCVLAQDRHDTESSDVCALSVAVDLTVDDYAVTSDFMAVTTGMREGDETPSYWASVQCVIARKQNGEIHFPES